MKVDEFLTHQQNVGIELTATIESVVGKTGVVKLTPYTHGKCGCSSSFEVQVNDIEDINPTGEAIWCCGKQLRTAKVTIRRSATMPIHDVLGMVMQRGTGDDPGACVRRCISAYWYCVQHKLGNCDQKHTDCLAGCQPSDPG